MKPAFYVLLAIISMPFLGIANESDLSKRKLPTLPIKVAIDKAADFIKEKDVKIEGRFLTSVQYHGTGPWTELNQTQKTSGPYWQITYEPEIWADGGQVFVLVYMDRTVRYVKGR